MNESQTCRQRGVLVDAGRLAALSADFANRTAALEREVFALAGREFLARDAFSMADLVAFTSVDFGKVAGLRVGDELPALKRWYDAIRERPSARA